MVVNLGRDLKKECVREAPTSTDSVQVDPSENSNFALVAVSTSVEIMVPGRHFPQPQDRGPVAPLKALTSKQENQREINSLIHRYSEIHNEPFGGCGDR